MKKRPGDAASRQLRVGRDERETYVELLQEHYAAGRLHHEELAERVGQALTAVTRADLEVVLQDLPQPRRHLDRAAARPRGRMWAAAALALVVGAVGAGALHGSGPTPLEAEAQDICLSTGQLIGSQAGCPEVSEVQQQIFQDAARAGRAAQELQDLSDTNPDLELFGLATRARVLAGRAENASLDAQKLVAADTGDDPSEKAMADLAKTSARAADAAQETADQALDKADD